MSAEPAPVTHPRSTAALPPAGTDTLSPAAARIAARRGLVTPALAAAFAVALAALCLIKFRSYLYDDIDLATFVQALERLRHGSTFVSIRGMSWLGDHASYVLFLLAPLQALAHHPATMLVVQAAWLAAGAVPVHRMTVRALGGRGPGGDRGEGGVPAAATRPLAAWAMVAAYLLHPALGYLGLFEFHPEFVATTALLFTLDALAAGRTRACLAWVALALLAREDVALVTAALGVWALAFRRPRAAGAGAALLVASLASLAVTLLLVRPHFTSAAAQYGAMYRALGDSPAGALANLARDPLHLLRLLVTTPGNPLDSRLKVELFVQLLLPFAFLPLLAPATLLVALPVLAEHLLSQRMQQHTIVFHYSALVLPVLAWGAVEGLRRIAGLDPRASRRAVLAAGVALACAVFAQVAFGPLSPFGWLQSRRAIERVLPDDRDRIEAPVRDAMLARLPADGGVIAGFEFLARLASRPDVHSLHHVLAGKYTYSTAPYPEPGPVAAVLADWSRWRLREYAGTPDAGRRIARVIARNGLVPVEAAGDLVLFARGGRLSLLAPRPELVAAPALARFDGALEFLGARLAGHVDPVSGCVPLVTAWRRVAPLEGVYLMRLELVDAGGRVVSTHTRVLGYVVWPVADWAAGTPLAENYAFEPGVRLGPGRYTVRMGIARSGAGAPVRVEPAGLGSLELGSFSVAAPGR